MPDATHTPVPAVAWLRTAARRLREGGIEGADRDARLLLEHLTRIAPLDLVRDPALQLDPAALARLDAALARRLAHEPVSRIAGARAFYGREFLLTPATLDPRPETETLVDAVLELVREEKLDERPFRFVDVGTGTGCIAITLLAELPLASAVATDISPLALDVAAENARRYGVERRLHLQLADVLDGVQGPFDLAVSNPPYVVSEQIAGLAPEVRLHDPLPALDGGADGLTFYRLLTNTVSSYVPSGWLVMEVGAGQAGDVAGLARQADPVRADHHLRTWRDLGGHLRVVAFRTRGSQRA